MKHVDLDSGVRVGLTVAGGEDSGPTFLLAHGAGTDRTHRSIVGIQGALAERGVRVVTFDYPFTAAGRRRPDPAAVLLDCHATVASAVAAAYGGPLVLGGRSMGGRIATMLVAAGHPASGIVLYAYPLHPTGKPDRLRVEHLPAVTAPMLFFQGSRDTLSRSDLFDRHVRPLPTATTVDVEGADHGFRGRGWSEPGVFEFLAEHTVAWLDGLGIGPRRR